MQVLSYAPRRLISPATLAEALHKRRMRCLVLVLILAAIIGVLYPVYLSNFTLEHKLKLAR